MPKTRTILEILITFRAPIVYREIKLASSYTPINLDSSQYLQLCPSKTFSLFVNCFCGNFKCDTNELFAMQHS